MNAKNALTTHAREKLQFTCNIMLKLIEDHVTAKTHEGDVEFIKTCQKKKQSLKLLQPQLRVHDWVTKDKVEVMKIFNKFVYV